MLERAPEVVDKGFVLRSLRHFIDGLELDFARYAAEFHQSNQWEAEGYNSAADWMRFNCHMISYAVFCLKKKKTSCTAAERATQTGSAPPVERLPQRCSTARHTSLQTNAQTYAG